MTAQSPDRPADEVRLEELAGKATPGPWDWTAEDCSMAWLHGPDELADHVITSEVCDNCQESIPDKSEWIWGRCSAVNAEDAVYIAAAHPQAILTLLSRLTALRAERDDAKRFQQAAEINLDSARKMHAGDREEWRRACLAERSRAERAESERDAANAHLTALLDILKDAQICEPAASRIREHLGANQQNGERP